MFTAVKPEDWLFHDIKYDFLSAGHYPTHKYTVDGTATIVPKVITVTNNRDMFFPWRAAHRISCYYF